MFKIKTKYSPIQCNYILYTNTFCLNTFWDYLFPSRFSPHFSSSEIFRSSVDVEEPQSVQNKTPYLQNCATQPIKTSGRKKKQKGHQSGR